MSPSKSAETRYVTLAQASRIASLSTRTLRRAIADGRLPGYRVGRLIRLDIDDLHRLIRGESNEPVRRPDRLEHSGRPSLNA
jgi:excisionase family DNA binding protein